MDSYRELEAGEIRTFQLCLLGHRTYGFCQWVDVSLANQRLNSAAPNCCEQFGAADHNGSNKEIIMAKISVTPEPTHESTHNSNSSGYQLHPVHRAAILAGSDGAKRTQKIEKQRQQFIKKNGSDGTH
jgi:hypothetical protein